MDYSIFYQKISKPFRPYAKVIYTFNKILMILFYIAYPLVLLLCWKENCVWKAICFPGISFVLLSVIRHFINEPRPYETWDIHPLIHKKTKGHSMPSRHVFSAVIISMCYLMVYPLLGYIFLGVSVIAACIRVIAGVHYPKDVIIGYCIGVLVGICMIYI